MTNREFKRLRDRKDAQDIKEEFMKGKHTNLTGKQLEKICDEGLGHGGVAFGKKMTIEKMQEKKAKLEIKQKGNKKKILSLIEMIDNMFK